MVQCGCILSQEEREEQYVHRKDSSRLGVEAHSLIRISWLQLDSCGACAISRSAPRQHIDAAWGPEQANLVVADRRISSPQQPILALAAMSVVECTEARALAKQSPCPAASQRLFLEEGPEHDAIFNTHNH